MIRGENGQRRNTTLFDFDPHDGGRPEGTKPTAKGIRQKIERQQYRCAMSGVELTPDDASVDHITPLKHGGDSYLENLQVVHREVNRMKGTLTMDQFKNWCRLIVDNS